MKYSQSCKNPKIGMQMESLKLFQRNFYTIHAEKGSITIPCVYTLLTSKTQAICAKLFPELNHTLNSFLIMVDFEKVVINAFEMSIDEVSNTLYYNNGNTQFSFAVSK